MKHQIECEPFMLLTGGQNTGSLRRRRQQCNIVVMTTFPSPNEHVSLSIRSLPAEPSDEGKIVKGANSYSEIDRKSTVVVDKVRLYHAYFNLFQSHVSGCRVLQGG